MNSWETTINASATPQSLGAGEKHTPAADDPAAPFGLPLRTRIALWLLLGCALSAIAFMWERSGREVVETVETVLPTQSLKSAPAKLPAKAAPAAAPKTEKPEKVTPPAMAEIEVLALLSREDPTFNTHAAIARLKPYTQSEDPAISSAAAQTLAPLTKTLEAQARGQARSAAETALDQAAEGDFPAALLTLQSAAKALPADLEWSTERGTKQIQNLNDAITARRADAQAAALREIESAWRGSDDAVRKSAATQWLAHRDPEIRQAAEALKTRIVDEMQNELVKRQQRESDARAAWLEFFAKFGALVGEGDLENADLLVQNSALAIRGAGAVSDVKAVLAGCAEDLVLIRKLQDAALVKARSSKRNVSFTLRRGRAEGNLDGVDGRQIFLAINGGARVGVKIENLTWPSLLGMFGAKDLIEGNMMPAVWAVNAYESPEDALVTLPRAYANAKLPLPAHWAERLRLEKYQQYNKEVATKLNELNEAMKGGNVDAIKDKLEAVRPAIKAFEDIEPLSEVRKKLVASADKLVGRAARARVVLQNGVTPTADYVGINTDQISQYRDSVKKTDVGVQFGLKVGSSGGVHRVLIHFDGLEAAIGRARVKKATFEMYQIESPQSSGSQIALFRLKKPWVPDAGTWMSFDAKGKDADWTIAGVSGDADVESKDDAKMTIDTKKNVWRSFDLTAYVQEVLAGKLPNQGFLLRVINGEPEHQVRFYPETDIDAAKDKSLRPRLILEVEAE